MLEEAAPLTEPPRGGWLGEWLLSVLGMRWVLFSGRAVTVYAVTALVVTVLVMTVLVACSGAGC